MNWAFQFPTYAINPLDYSKNAWLGLDENDLSEPAGIGTAGYQTAIGGGSPAPLVNGFKATGTGIKYNNDVDTTDLHVVRNLNNFGYPGTPSESSCNSNIFTKYYGVKLGRLVAILGTRCGVVKRSTSSLGKRSTV